MEWPPAFKAFLQVLSVFTLDFLSPDCAGGGASFYRTVYVWSAVPAGLSVLLGLSYVMQLARVWINEGDMERHRVQLYSSHLFGFLVLSYMALPAVTSKQYVLSPCFGQTAHS